MKKRIFVSDAVCAFPYGHNPVGVKGFSNSLGKYFSKVVPLVSRELPHAVEMPPLTDRTFRFYYRDKIKIPRNGEKSLVNFVSTVKRHPFIRKSREIATRNLRLHMVKDPMRAEARSDWRRIFKKYAITERDTIFFPCGDYYSVRGLFHLLQNLPLTKWPAVHLHLINVMENACARGTECSTTLLRDLLATGLVGHRIFVSTEVPAYAEKLSGLLFAEVKNFAFPPNVELEPFRDKSFFQVSAIGSGRGDKGYFRLAAIAEAYAGRFADSNVRFAVQSMNPTQCEYDAAYQDRLEGLSNVDLLPPQLSDAQMRDLYAASDLLLLPYCQKTYRYRGSAVMSEGYGCGRPLLVTSGTAFEGIVHRFGNGLVCNTDEEFIEAIHRYTQTSKKDLRAAAKKSRNAFFADYQKAIESMRDRMLHAKPLPPEMKTAPTTR